MRNEVILDDRGIPDIMVAFTPEELGLPDVLRGRKVAEYMIGKYLASMVNGRAYSLPLRAPAVNVNHDHAIQLCEAKGPGWHLFTNDEWAAVARLSAKNGTIPHGNTDSGKSHDNPDECGEPIPGSVSKTLTGSGPITWNHDHSPAGISDMCGNVWEHVGGIRFVDGMVQVIPDNAAAAGADQSAESGEWLPIYSADGDPIYYNVETDHINIQTTKPALADCDGVAFCELDACGIAEIPEQLIRLGLYPEPGCTTHDAFWLNSDGERCVYRGGNWSDGAGAGVFDLSGANSRGYVGPTIGFRPAFVRYSGESDDLDHLDERAAPATLPECVREEIALHLTARIEGTHLFDVSAFKERARRASVEELEEALDLLDLLDRVKYSNRSSELFARDLELQHTHMVELRGGSEDE